MLRLASSVNIILVGRSRSPRSTVPVKSIAVRIGEASVLVDHDRTGRDRITTDGFFAEHLRVVIPITDRYRYSSPSPYGVTKYMDGYREQFLVFRVVVI